MDERAADAASIAGDAVADAFEATEFLHIDVSEFAGMPAFITSAEFSGFAIAQPADPALLERPADDGGRDPDDEMVEPGARPSMSMTCRRGSIILCRCASTSSSPPAIHRRDDRDTQTKRD